MEKAVDESRSKGGDGMIMENAKEEDRWAEINGGDVCKNKVTVIKEKTEEKKDGDVLCFSY